MQAHDFYRLNGSGVGFFPNGQERVPLDVEESPTGYVVIKLANGFKSQSPLQFERLFIEMTNP